MLFCVRASLNSAKARLFSDLRDMAQNAEQYFLKKEKINNQNK